jgi:hypothetical protein
LYIYNRALKMEPLSLSKELYKMRHSNLMKRIFNYCARTGLIAVWCFFMAIPAMAQHRGGGGGGGGGGHAGGGGGGFSGGGGHPGMGVSAGRSGIAPSHFGTTARGGNYNHGINRGSVGVAHGVNAASTTAHRGYVNGGTGTAVYGHGGTYGYYNWGVHGGYYYYGGYYGSYYYPWIGLGFAYLPYGYYSFYWGGYPYYYGGGYFYGYNNGQYTVVEPPVGASVDSLPSDAQSIVINGQQYYELNGVYYKPVTKDDGTVVYEVTGKDGQLNTDSTGNSTVMPKVGDIVSTLPPDCRKVTLNGVTYYVSADGIYYQETKDSNNKKAYKIVGLDGITPDNQ